MLYSLIAVAAPQFVVSQTVVEFSNATSALLPIPSGGTQSAAIAASGVALLEGCLGIGALVGRTDASETLAHLENARCVLLESVRTDVHAYSGLMSSVYAKPSKESPDDVEAQQAAVAEEAERRHWLSAATEVQLRIAEVAIEAVKQCSTLDSTATVKESLKCDWLTGVRLLKTAVEVSVQYAEWHAVEMARDEALSDIESRLCQLRDAEHLWVAVNALASPASEDPVVEQQ